MNIKIGPFHFYDHHIGDYMRRWIYQHFFGTARLHNIRRPDADPDLHDHPWPFVSIIVRGGYREQVVAPGGDPVNGPFQYIELTPGCISFRRATDAHRIVELLGDSTWTLVFSGKKVRTWGFWTPRGFVPGREYVHSNKGVEPDEYARRLEEVGVSE